MTQTTTFFVSPDELARLRVERADVRLLDVRTPAEFRDQRIDGSYNVPLDALETHAPELRERGGPVVIVCRSGARACRADELLRAHGVPDVRVLEGGVLAWSDAGQPTSRGR
jgi:rhodanese-related sulfurtransferase